MINKDYSILFNSIIKYRTIVTYKHILMSIVNLNNVHSNYRYFHKSIQYMITQGSPSSEQNTNSAQPLQVKLEKAQNTQGLRMGQ